MPHYLRETTAKIRHTDVVGKLGATVGLGSVGLGSVGLGLVGALAGCFRLDAAEKTACAGQGDCVDGYVCLSRVCVSAGSVDADVELLSESTTPLDTITNVTGSGIDDVSAGVSDGELLRWNGTTWSVEPFCSQCASEAFLWQSARDDVWAVDAEGRVAHRDASGWKLRSPEAPPRSISVVAGVAGRPDLGVWAVGDGGLVAHWNGTWTSFDSTTPKDLSAVWVAATDSGA